MATAPLPPTVEHRVSKMCFLLEHLRKLTTRRWTQEDFWECVEKKKILPPQQVVGKNVKRDICLVQSRLRLFQSEVELQGAGEKF